MGTFKFGFGQQLVQEIKQAIYFKRFTEKYRASPKAFLLYRVLTFSPEIIRQDFHGKVFAESLASALVLEVHDQVEAYSLTTEDD